MAEPTTPPLIDDLTNWLEGIGVAMINLLDETQLTALARSDWNKSMKILEAHSDRTEADRAGQRLGYATMLGALVQSPYAVQQALECLHRQLIQADPTVGHTARWSPFEPGEHEGFVAAAIVDPEVRKRLRHEFTIDLASRLGRLTTEFKEADRR
jgi:hypothetical protein